ncbi:unnamed protein product [Brassica rapa subsp. narinosa]
MYKHVEKLAQEIRKGAAPGDGVNAKLWQVPETLQEDVLSKMSSPLKSDAHLITPNDLAEAGEYFASQKARIFYSTESQGGGQETMV